MQGQFLFDRPSIDASTLPREEIEAFKANAEPFEYTSHLGTVKGYKNSSGAVLVVDIRINPESETLDLP